MASIASSQVSVMSFLSTGRVDTQHDTSVITAAIAAQGNYRLCREGQQEGSIGASVLTLEPVLQGHSSQTWSTFFQIFFSHATARTFSSYGLPACVMFLHRWFVNISL
jgi:hypothetical protein